jgi:hypothetical protein
MRVGLWWFWYTEQAVSITLACSKDPTGLELHRLGSEKDKGCWLLIRNLDTSDNGLELRARQSQREVSITVVR